MSITLKKFRWPLGSAILSAALFIGLSGVAMNAQSSWWGDNDDDDHYERDYEAVNASNPLNLDECGACHMAYPAQLLPKESWQLLLSNLDDHFGEDASLDDATQKELLSYLTANASDSNQAGKFRKFTRGINMQQPPLRITELNYFEHKHDEINVRKMVTDNPDVGSFSQCQACHEKAEQGVFDDDTVNIPNFGRWDD